MEDLCISKDAINGMKCTGAVRSKASRMMAIARTSFLPPAMLFAKSLVVLMLFILQNVAFSSLWELVSVELMVPLLYAFLFLLIHDIDGA